MPALRRPWAPSSPADRTQAAGGSVSGIASAAPVPVPVSGAVRFPDRSLLPDDLRFRLRLAGIGVRFPLTEQRCYFQFFVDADGFSPLEGASLALELVEDGRVVGLNRVEIADLSGQGLSRRVRERHRKPSTGLAGRGRWLAPVQISGATGAFQPAGTQGQQHPSTQAPKTQPTRKAAPRRWSLLLLRHRPTTRGSRHRLADICAPPGATGGHAPSRHL